MKGRHADPVGDDSGGDANGVDDSGNDKPDNLANG